jgi:excisionase family DNA binding protein
MDELLTVAQVAHELRVHRRTVYRWIAEGKLPAVRIDRLWRISRRNLTAFLERRGSA